MKPVAIRYRPTPNERSPWLRPGSHHRHLPRYFGAVCLLLTIFIYLRWSEFALAVATFGYGVIPVLAIFYAVWREKRTSRLAMRKKSREMIQAARERFGLKER